MSAIYEYLDAHPEQFPFCGWAAPRTRLIVQPLIGNWSDDTWGFLAAAILTQRIQEFNVPGRTLCASRGGQADPI